jgi:hypothetical protein
MNNHGEYAMKTGFGWIEIEGSTYEKDVILHADGSVTKRKKKLSKPLKGEYGHTPLSEAELGFIDDERPDAVFVGTGQDGALPITPEAQDILDHYKAEVGPTPGIIDRIEKARGKKVAILHVTC